MIFWLIKGFFVQYYIMVSASFSKYDAVFFEVEEVLVRLSFFSS